jgi:hypothetical protein
MSTQVTINDVPPKTQITATAGQTVFTTNWTANASSDVVVYARTSAQEPDDLTQEVSSANYTVAFIGGSETVEVTFLVGLSAGDVVTITRNTPADRLNLYTNTNFTPSMLNQDIGILTLVDQQAQLYNDQVTPHYNVSATPDLGDTITGAGGDIYLPILEANQFWVKNTGNTEITAVDLPSGGGQLPVTLPLLTYTSTPYLTNEANLGALSTGLLYQTVAAGIASFSTLGTTGTGDVVLDNGPTLTNPIINQINDTNGNTSMSFYPVPAAVNYISCINNISGSRPYFAALGADTNIGLQVNTKGTGQFVIGTEALTQPIIIASGTSKQHTTVFQMSNTAAARTVTFQDADGTIAYLSDIGAGNNLKAWVNFDGTTSPGTIRSSLNVSSVTVTGTGQYTVNFTTPLADTNYASFVGYDTSANASYLVAPTIYTSSKAVGSIDLNCRAGSNSVYTFTAVNYSQVSVAILNL